MTPRLRVAAVVTAALLVLAGCGNGGSEEGTTASITPGATTDTTATTGPPDSGVTSTTGPPGAAGGNRSGGGTSGGGGSGGGGSAGAGLAPAQPGTYNYATSGASTFGISTVPFPAVTTLLVDPPAGTRQHAVRNLRDAAGNGPVQEMTLDFRTAGIYFDNLKLTTTIAGTTNSIDLRPVGQALFLPTGAGPGAHSEFEMTDGGRNARVVVDVTGREQVSAGGRTVEALVVRAVANLPGTDITGQVDLTYWFAPSVRLPVKERVVSDASAGGGLIRFHSEYSATIQRIP